MLLTTSLAMLVAADPPYASFAEAQVDCTHSGIPCHYNFAGGCADFSGEHACHGTCQESQPLFFDVGDVLVPESGSFETLDEWPEVVVANTAHESSSSANQQIALFRNMADSDDVLELAALYDLEVEGGKPYDAEFAEMDTDPGSLPSKLDIVVTVQSGSARHVVILYNNGYGDYGVRSQRVIELDLVHVNGLKTADFDGDGDVDIGLSGAMGTGTRGPQAPVMEVLLWSGGSGDGFLHSGPFHVDAMDPNHPRYGEGSDLVTPVLCPPQVAGRRDLIMSMRGRDVEERQIVLFKNAGTDSNGEILWNKSTKSAVNSNTIAFGKLQTGIDTKDVVLADNINSFWTLKQDTDPCPDYPSLTGLEVDPGIQPWCADVAKIDAIDNKQDVVVACADGFGFTAAARGCVALFKSNGDGTFQATPQIIRTEGRPDCDPNESEKACCPESRIVKLVDMNDDGRNDIVVTNYGSGSITVLLNTSTVPPPNPGGG